MRGCSPAPPLPVHRQPPPSAFEYMTVQDTILCGRWLRTQGRDRGRSFRFCPVPTRGWTITSTRGYAGLRLPRREAACGCRFIRSKLRHACVAAVESISPDMVDNALNRLRQETRRGSCSLRTADALERFCREVLLSDRVQRCGTLREQTTVINAMLSQRYFTDRAPQVPLDADGDAHRPSAGKRFSDGSRAHRSAAVPTGAARIASAGAGRRFRLLDGRRRRHALFWGSTAARRCFLCGCARARARRR